MTTKVSSVRFENEYREDGGAGKYVVELDEDGNKSNQAFQPYSWIDYIVPFKIENAKQRLIAAAEKVGAIKPERKYAGDFFYQGFIETIPILGGEIVTVVGAENPNQRFQYNTGIFNNSFGIKLGVRLGRSDLKEYENSPAVYTVSLEKIMGNKKRIKKNILPEINLDFDKNELDTNEKVLIMNELEDDISQILSTTPQEIARKV